MCWYVDVCEQIDVIDTCWMHSTMVCCCLWLLFWHQKWKNEKRNMCKKAYFCLQQHLSADKSRILFKYQLERQQHASHITSSLSTTWTETIRWAFQIKSKHKTTWHTQHTMWFLTQCNVYVKMWLVFNLNSSLHSILLLSSSFSPATWNQNFVPSFLFKLVTVEPVSFTTFTTHRSASLHALNNNQYRQHLNIAVHRIAQP